MPPDASPPQKPDDHEIRAARLLMHAYMPKYSHYRDVLDNLIDWALDHDCWDECDRGY
jgi:hypothetical protein